MRQLILFIFFTLIFGCNHPESIDYNREYKVNHSGQYQSFVDTATETPYPQNSISYKVIGVNDGDTFKILVDGRSLTVRLAHIDCPENRQPFGEKAKQFVSVMCFAKYITLVHKGEYDRFKRLIAEIILEDGSNLNQELVRNGLAWHFKKYSRESSYTQLEDEARKMRVGLWAESNPTPPWLWRK